MKYCSVCGSTNKDASLFCESCGQKLLDSNREIHFATDKNGEKTVTCPHTIYVCPICEQTFSQDKWELHQCPTCKIDLLDTQVPADEYNNLTKEDKEQLIKKIDFDKKSYMYSLFCKTTENIHKMADDIHLLKNIVVIIIVLATLPLIALIFLMGML